MDNIILQKENEVVEVQNQLMTMVDEAVTAESTVPYEAASATVSTASEVRSHDIPDFLKRELKLVHGTISSTMVAGATVAQLSIPGDLLNHPMISFKIDGFRYIKGTVQVRVVFNNQPFQAGIFKALYFPVLSPDGLYNSSLTTLKQMTGLDGVDVNLESREPLILDIPYIYPLPAYDMLSEPDPFAYFRLIVYSPLSTGNISYTIFARFVDVELSMPISNALPSFTRQYTKVKQNLGQVYEFTIEDLDVAKQQVDYKRKDIIRKGLFSLLFLLFFGAGIYLINIFTNRPRRKVNQQIGAEERKAIPGGTISGIANAVTGVANAVSGIPFLSSIAKPVGLVSSVVANIASMFGWSKPRSEQVLTIVRPKIVDGFNNTNNTEFSQQLALDSLNKTIVTDGKFGSDIDQMSFASLWRVPQYINDFNVSTSSAVDSRVFMLRLNPADMTSTLNSGSDPTITTTNLGMICSLFELWKGSLCFNFKMAKTQFHSMRLAIVYFNQDIEPPLEYTHDLVKNYQIIWDIRETYQQTVCIPYIQAIEWLNIHSKDTTFKSDTGYIGVYVINELVVASSASNTVNVIVEAFAGHDFHVAIPKNPELLGYYIKPITAYSDSNSFMIDVEREGMNVVFDPHWSGGRTSLSVAGVENTVLLSSLPSGLVLLPDLTPVTSILVGVGPYGSTLIYQINSETRVTLPFPLDVYETVLPFSLRWPNAIPPVKKLKTVPLATNEIVKETSDKLDDVEILNDIKKDVKLEELSDLSLKFRIFKQLVTAVRASVDSFYEGALVFKKEKKFQFTGYPEFKGTIVHILGERVGDVVEVEFQDKNHVKYLKLTYNVKTKVNQEIGKEEALKKQVFDNITGSSVITPFTHDHTVGENIMSLRQLAHRYTLFRKAVFSDLGTLFGGGGYTMFNPFSFTGENNSVIDYMSFMAPLFRFYNGELFFKYRILDSAGNIYTKPVEVFLLSNFNGSTPPNLINVVSSRVVHFLSLEGLGEFTVPYYNRNHKTIVGDTTNTGLLVPIPHRVLIRTPNYEENLTIEVFRSIGENFAFGTTLSAPTFLAAPR